MQASPKEVVWCSGKGKREKSQSAHNAFDSILQLLLTTPNTRFTQRSFVREEAQEVEEGEENTLFSPPSPLVKLDWKRDAC